jgi:hypothetical protein
MLERRARNGKKVENWFLPYPELPNSPIDLGALEDSYVVSG